jgi:TolB-like protein/tetratricopeptide (TPR) repeat protein
MIQFPEKGRLATEKVGHFCGSNMVYRFDAYTLDVARGSLRTDDRDVELRPKSFEVLCYLVQNAGRLVTKEELIKTIWPNVVVNDESLTRCVSDVRFSIQDIDQKIIRTIPRRGYRFTAPVSRLESGEPTEQSSAPTLVPRLLEATTHPALPDRPSIAVLPFQNMSEDGGQEYFADGMVEEIITALCRFSNLFVIARNSSFTYKGRAVDVKQVGRELGVRYVLEGSVRKAANRIRITAQLIDAATGAHLWAERFDGGLEDIFTLQDQVSASAAGTIAPKVEQAEIQRAKRKPTRSLDSYDYFLRGVANAHEWTREANAEAQQLFYRAIELDPNFASAYGMAAWCFVQRTANGWENDRSHAVIEALRLARKAVDLGREDSIALCRGGHAIAVFAGDLDAAATFIGRALTLNSNLAPAWHSSGYLKIWIGEPEIALQQFGNVIRLSPLDSLMPSILAGVAFAHFFAGHYCEASSLAEQALRERPNLHTALRMAAASNVFVGNLTNARKAMARLREIDPLLRVSRLKDLTPLRRPDDVFRYEEGLRKAGLPE